MPTPRGRFSVEIREGEIYALGGSDGQHAQDNIIKLSLDDNKWKSVGRGRNSALVSQGNNLKH